MEELILGVFLSVPFYFIWDRLAPVYFASLPPLYQRLPFWHCVGLFTLASIARLMIFPPRTDIRVIKSKKWW